MVVESELRNAFAALREGGGQLTLAEPALPAPPQLAQRDKLRRGPQGAEPSQGPKVKPNRYGGKCASCSGYVEAGAGSLARESSKWVIRHIGACPPVEPKVEEGEPQLPDPPIWPGIYTLESPPSGLPHRTFKVMVQPEDDDFAPGATILLFLSGPDNTEDYTSFAFIKPGPKVVVWRRYRDNDGLVEDAEAFMVDPEAALKVKNCLRCNAELTTPDSLKAGYGPVCITKALGA